MTTALKDRTERAEKAAAPEKKKSFLKSKKAIIGLVVLLAVGGGAYKFLAPAPKPAPPTGGAIINLPANTLNLQDDHYLKIGIAVQLLKVQPAGAEFKNSEAQQIVLDEFSNRSVASLSSASERAKLMAELTTQLKAAYKDEVYKVFLTQFVTQ